MAQTVPLRMAAPTSAILTVLESRVLRVCDTESSETAYEATYTAHASNPVHAAPKKYATKNSSGSVRATSPA